MAVVKSKRHIKKQLLKILEENYDRVRYDYVSRVKRARHESLLNAAIIAGAAYLLSFGLAYYGWKAGRVHEETLARYSWILMVPATAVGGFTFLFSMNRRVARISDDVFNDAERAEREGGLLWRFAPILHDIAPGDERYQVVIEHSRAGTVRKAEPEDYCGAVARLRAALSDSGTTGFGADAAERAARNFGWSVSA